jgi:hypothetical protein
MFPLKVRIFAILFSWTLLSNSGLLAADLSSYRHFKLGMNLRDAQTMAQTNPSQTRVIHRRPALIEQFEWRPPYMPANFADRDSVKDVLLSFYNNELFRMVVNYDRYRTEGLTTADMIDAISATYGTAVTPDTEVLFPSAYSEKVKVIARWENAEYSFNLVRSPYQPGFALIGFSKRLDSLAQTADAEATRLDEVEAPQREAEQQRKAADAVSAKQDKARLANKPSFRP